MTPFRRISRLLAPLGKFLDVDWAIKYSVRRGRGIQHWGKFSYSWIKLCRSYIVFRVDRKDNDDLIDGLSIVIPLTLFSFSDI